MSFMNYSIKELKKNCLKKNGPISCRLYFRRVAVYITWLFVRTSISPNQVTFLSFILQLVGSALLFFSSYKYSVIAVILLQLRMIFDSVDGELARCKNMRSGIGVYYDRLIHAIEPLAFIGIAYASFIKFNDITFFLLAFSITMSMLFLRLTISEKYRVYYEQKLTKKKEQKKESKISLLKIGKLFYDKSGFLFRIPALFNIVAVLAFFNKLHWSLYFYGILFPFAALGSFLYESMVRFKQVE